MNMVTLTREGLKDPKWKGIGVRLPQFNLEEMVRRTKEMPTWIHIAPSNLYIGEIAPIQQVLLESGIIQEGIVGIEAWDGEIVDRIYRPHDNIRVRIVMSPKGDNEIRIVASTADTLFVDRPKEWEKGLDYFAKPSLQMVTITCTEKGYSIRDPRGRLTGSISRDIQNGPGKPGHIMAKLAAFVYHRYQNGAAPIALVSMDNCSENGKRLSEAVSFIAQEWVHRKLAEKGFLQYLEGKKVSFPWTMIDRITPRPSEENKEWLEDRGVQNMEILRTAKGTFIAPFVNTEHISYLVIEEDFPNGRPPLEKADTSGNRIIFVESSEIVDKCEKMKVGTCLNPIHTTLATFGCILGFDHIYQEMKDSLLKNLVYKQVYEEGIPVVVHPGVIDPEEFLKQVLEERLVNTNIPDTPGRIATDTSQKVGVRYGGTIRAHGKNSKNLKYIPLAIAGWCRYLLGIADSGRPFELSPDPMLKELKKWVAGIKLGRPETLDNKLKPLLSNSQIFGIDLYSVGVGEKIEEYFKRMITGPGAVRKSLEEIVEGG